MPPTVTVHRATDITPHDRATIDRWLEAMFPYDPDFPEPEDGGDVQIDYYVRVWEGDEWVSIVQILDHTITAGGQPVRIAGIGGVSTREDRRERGYASMAMREAARFMFEDMDVEFGMLFCDPHRIPFYASLGWQVINERFRFKGDNGGAEWANRFMILPPDALAVWPPGEVDCCGYTW